jgi:transcriptional regulator with XRE-family HTH domain
MINLNLKFLRNLHNLSQAELAEQLSIPRTTLSAYERGFVEPNIELIIKMAKFFKVSVDDLIAYNLEHNNPDHESKDGLKILAISVDTENKSNIELIETKASAGYFDSCSDPEYIKELPKIYFPNIPQGTYRGFQISGDSMLPVESGTIVISSYIEKLSDIKNEKTYIIVSKSEGVVYKRVRNLSNEKALLLISDNSIYMPYKIPYSEIAEVWQHYAHLSFNDDKISSNSLLDDKITDMHNKLNHLYEKIN